MTAIFYNYAGEHEEVNKTLGTGTSVNNVRLLPGQDVTSPSIECDFASRPSYNYVYISALGRYYFIDRWTYGGGQIWTMTLTVDTLYTFSSLLDYAHGTVDYSALGSPAIIDRRMTFTDCPTVVRQYGAFSNTYYYSVKYWSGDLQPHVAIMTRLAYAALIAEINSLADEPRALAWSCIIDVAIAYNIDIQAGATSTTTISLWQTSFLEAGQVVINLTITGGYYDIADGDDVSTVIKYKDYNVTTLGMSTSSGNFWDVNAKWTVLIPETGAISFSPSDFGLTTVTSTVIRVYFEPYECAYVIMPVINSTAYTTAMITTPCNTRTILPIDSRYDNLQGQAMATALSVGGTVISSVASIAGGIATSNPALIGVGASQAAGAVSQTVNGVNDYRAAKAAAAVSGSTVGAAGGSPSWVDGDLKTRIYTMKITATLQGSASTFRSRWALPDGAVRTASDMDGYGYFKFGDVELDDTSNMTAAEVDMLKSQLLAGCRWSA